MALRQITLRKIIATAAAAAMAMAMLGTPAQAAPGRTAAIVPWQPHSAQAAPQPPPKLYPAPSPTQIRARLRQLDTWMARRGYSPVTARWLNRAMRRAHATRTRGSGGTFSYSAPFVLSLANIRDPVFWLNALNFGDQEQVRTRSYTTWVLQVNEDGSMWKFHDRGPHGSAGWCSTSRRMLSVMTRDCEKGSAWQYWLPFKTNGPDELKFEFVSYGLATFARRWFFMGVSGPPEWDEVVWTASAAVKGFWSAWELQILNGPCVGCHVAVRAWAPPRTRAQAGRAA